MTSDHVISAAHRDLVDGRGDLPQIGSVAAGSVPSPPFVVLDASDGDVDLLARRERAAAEGWTGEVEGLDLTLTFLRSKRQQTQRAASMRSSTVNLGLPPVRADR